MHPEWWGTPRANCHCLKPVQGKVREWFGAALEKQASVVCPEDSRRPLSIWSVTTYTAEKILTKAKASRLSSASS